MKPKNYHANYEPETTLFKEEVDVIVEVVKTVMRQLHPSAATGSFLLVGQKNDEARPEKEIVRFDFEGGPTQNRHLDKPSCWVTNHIVEKMLSVKTDGSCISYFTDDELDEEVLVLKTTAGRFLCAACVGEYPYCEVEIYLAVAKAISMMREEDAVLQESYASLLDEESGYLPDLRSLDEQVAKMLRRHKGSVLEKWRQWRKTVTEALELPLFFE